MGDKEFEANAYESAPEDTSKGVIRGVTHEVSPREIVEMLVTPKNPTVLMAKRMGNTTNVIILFDGHHVPNYVRYGRALVKCSLYRKQIDICYQCGRLGHRADVCPNPNSRICRGCGLENPPQDHECEAKCQLCGKDHPTADRRCNARYKLPYLVKRRRWERVRREEEETMYHEREAERLYRPGREDWRQRSEYRTKDGSGLEDFPKLQARERGRSTSNRARSRSRSRSRSRPKTSNTESTRAQGGGRSQSPKGKSNVNDAAGPLQVSWADAASGARAEAQAAFQNRVKTLEKELAQIRQSNVAFMDEIKKLRQENDRSRSGKVPRNEESSRVIREEKETAMEEDVALTAIKRKTENAPIETGVKKPKPATTLQGRQEEFEQKIETSIKQNETKFETKLEQLEVRLEAKIEAKMEALGKAILQQVQQMMADFEAKLAIWGPQTSRGGPVKTAIKPYTRPPVPAEGLENL
ncbi:arginine/serine-rich coiled-coil protein 2-like [Dermacentor albipictus]|uniref:arginine/serine-rich coiled-coil protein 2-like n=1 Tax=Dermacentor albipictus TaxID=60249 RepID=UPI0038FC6766